MSENNFQNRTVQPFTVFMNDFIQKETIFQKPSTKLTYMYLYSLKNCSTIFPSIETIALATCTSHSTVKRTLKELEQLKLLEIHNRNGLTSIYVLNDYNEVINNRGQNDPGQNELGQNELGTEVKMSYHPGQNELRKRKGKIKSEKEKNIINNNRVQPPLYNWLEN